jgi:hypothetical protein
LIGKFRVKNFTAKFHVKPFTITGDFKPAKAVVPSHFKVDTHNLM